MRIMLDYHCEHCGQTHERLVPHDLIESLCGCGKMAKKQISTPTIKLEGITGSFPGAWHKWADNHEKRAKKNALKEDH